MTTCPFFFNSSGFFCFLSDFPFCKIILIFEKCQKMAKNLSRVDAVRCGLMGSSGLGPDHRCVPPCAWLTHPRSGPGPTRWGRWAARQHMHVCPMGPVGNRAPSCPPGGDQRMLELGCLRSSILEPPRTSFEDALKHPLAEHPSSRITRKSSLMRYC